MQNQEFGPPPKKLEEIFYCIRGNRLVPIDSLFSNVEKHLCCSVCANNGVDDELDRFVDYLSTQNEVKKCNMNVDSLLQRYKMRYKRKKYTVRMKEDTVGIATQLDCYCSHCSEKDSLFSTMRLRSVFEGNGHQYNASESFTNNVMMVLGFQQIGGGGSDAMKVLTFLGLPNGKSMKDNKFKRIEDKIGLYIRQLTDELIQNALEEEVKLTFVDNDAEADYDKWLCFDADDEKRPAITTAYDMGWNKRSNGHRYDFISGMGYLLARYPKKL